MAELYTIIFLFLMIVASTKTKQLRDIYDKSAQMFAMLKGEPMKAARVAQNKKDN